VEALILEPDSRARFDEGRAFGLLNAALRVSFTPPKISPSRIPLLAKRPECFCAFKVHIGRTVVELSDRGPRVLLLDRDHAAIDTVLAERVMNMIPDGITKELTVAIEDRRATVAVDGDTLLESDVGTFDFSRIHLATFGHAFTVEALSLHPIVKEPLMVDTPNRSILLGAVWHPSHFNSGPGLHNHHFIAWEKGRAAMQTLITVSAPDSLVHDALVSLGFTPGDNLTRSVWSKRHVDGAPEPAMRAEGDALEVSIVYGGRAFDARDVLTDLEGNGYDFRFAGNRRLIPAWRSGCVVCLQSCPASTIANRTYTIRDLVRHTTSFTPATTLPFREGEPITVRIAPAQQH
jgi:hypothetical protein